MLVAERQGLRERHGGRNELASSFPSAWSRLPGSLPVVITGSRGEARAHWLAYALSPTTT